MKSKITPNGPLIARLRKNLGLTHTHVAKLMGLHRTSLIAVEQGQRQLTLEEATKLVQILQTSVGHIAAKKQPTMYDEIFSLPYNDRVFYCKKAYRHKALSEGQIAKLLKLSRVEVREILQGGLNDR